MLVTAYDLERRMSFFFKSHRARDEAARDFLMREAARATSAAPTYFEPAKVPLRDSGDYLALVDGGVFANNPGMCAYVEARTIFPKAKDFFMLSLGTGELTRSIPYDDAKGWGLAKWAQPLLGVVFDGVSDTVDYELRRLLSPNGRSPRYHRFQVILTEGNDDMDDASRTNLRSLRLLADNLVRDRSDDIDEVCALLTREIHLRDSAAPAARG